ncbi:hypothetical protein I5M27_16790 [Adhaeribacter sp. BT258]|uniref:VWA domain-containing protein n=1 Tax=Adhaeribacter terrigena TaxID=2793070 RepID=A0ABS1C5J0_9BACT|nr:hypothetical protein [Adhaeribacter terrigena]MBK0404653.1 hypothetical protein [Adhaeribacter terrigena]
MRSNSRLFFPLLLVFLMLQFSCFTRKDRQAETESVEATETVSSEAEKVPATKPTSTTENQITSIPKVNVFLEVSGGMVGFMPKGGAASEGTNFQKSVAGLLTEVNYSKAVQQKDFYFIREKNGTSQLQKSTYNDVLKTVSSGIPNPALGTELPEMLEQILKESGKTKAVSVIVSDFIYGPADKTKFNIIPQLIRGALNEAQEKDLVVSVFADQSNFTGSFHPAVKQPVAKRELKGTKMPYYVWVIGPQEEVILFNQKVFKDHPEQQAHFGFNYPEPVFEALTKLKPSGMVYCSERKPTGGCKSVTIGPQKDTPVEFEIGLNLESLPTLLQKPEYLKQNLQLNGKGFSGTIISVKQANAKDPAQEKYSHLVRVRITQAIAKSGQLVLTLPEKPAGWVNQWTTQNDNNPVAQPGKTFKLKEVLAGVQSLYSEQRNVFSISLNFIKDAND